MNLSLKKETSNRATLLNIKTNFGQYLDKKVVPTKIGNLTKEEIIPIENKKQLQPKKK